MPQNAQIHGSQYPVEKIFSNDFVFRIPPYQRPYAWEEEQAEELIGDIADFAFAEETDGQPVEDLEPYFLGSVVLIKEEGQPPADVVDGQQRLTTLTMLLAAVRARLDASHAGFVNDLIMEEGNPITGTEDRPRLEVRERDNTFFRAYIQEDGAFEDLRQLDEGQLSDPKRNIRSNTLLYADRLSDMAQEDCVRLAQYIVQKCYLVVVSTPTQKSAYRIFSVLNDRGMNLSHTDILKADILGAIEEEEERRAYAQKWDDIEEEQGRDAFQDLFGHIRTIYRKQKQRDPLVEEVREYVSPADQPKRFIDEVMKPFAEVFFTVRHAAYKSARGAGAVNRWLRWLGRIDNADWLPPAILYMNRHQSEPQKLATFFKHLERLAGGMMMYRANVNKRIKRYAKVLEAIEQGEDVLASGSPLHLSAEEQRDVLRAVGTHLYRTRRIRKYALMRLDATLAGVAASYDHDIITVEHVLPQNPKPESQWTAWFPDEEMREQHVDQLGNLVLLSRRRNSQASNYDFEKKKEQYFKTDEGASPFALTTQVLSEDAWTPKVVQRRQRYLLGKLRETWKLDDVPNDLLDEVAQIPAPEMA